MTSNASSNPAGASAAGGNAPLRLREDLIHPDPLLDCLVEIARLHGLNASRASLSASLPLVDGRLTLDLVERAGARAGLSTKVQRMAIDDIDPYALPAILILKGNRACVLLGWDAPEGGAAPDAKLLLPETAQGSVTLPRAELEKRYTGVVRHARPHFRFDSRTEPPAAPAPAAGAPGQPETFRSRHWFWGAMLAQRFVYRDVMWAALLIN